MRHAILFLAANPCGVGRLALDQEVSAIRNELERAGYRDSFEFVMRWAAEPLDLLRELRKVQPTVVHFSGHGAQSGGAARKVRTSRRNMAAITDNAIEDGALYFQDLDGRPRLVSTAALTETLAAAGASVRLVVLNACSSQVHARDLLVHVDCVIDVAGSIQGEAARSFAAGFYGGLAERASIAAAFQQGRAAIRLAGLPDGDRLQLQVREGVEAAQVVLASPGRQRREACKSYSSRLLRAVR